MNIADYLMIVSDNDDCVVMGFKPEITAMDKIASGIFEPGYEMIRVTKGRDHTYTVYEPNGKYWSWDYGFSGYTLVAESVWQLKRAIDQFINICGIDMNDTFWH